MLRTRNQTARLRIARNAGLVQYWAVPSACRCRTGQSVNHVTGMHRQQPNDTMSGTTPMGGRKRPTLNNSELVGDRGRIMAPGLDLDRRSIGNQE